MLETVGSLQQSVEIDPTVLAPFGRALIYWRALGAPASRIADALKCTSDEVMHGLDKLSGITVAAEQLPHSAVPWSQRTVTALIRRGLSRPDASQLVFVPGEGVLTAGDVKQIVERLCAGLAQYGIGKGDRVAVDSTQRLDSYLVTLAVVLLGGVVVRLGDTVGPQALRSMIESAPAKATFSTRLDMIGDTAAAGMRVPLNDDGLAVFLDACPQPADRLLESLPNMAPDDAAFVGYTSGSTGQPKAITSTHEAVFRSTETAQLLFGFDGQDIFCTATDFTAASGLRSLVTLPFASGGRVVIPDRQAREDPLALALLCAQYGVTRLTAVPAVPRSLNRAGGQVRADDLNSLRTVFCGSGVLDPQTAQQFQDRFGIPVVDYYAGREFSTAAYSEEDGVRTISAGGGVPCNCLISIVDEHQRAVPAGGSGEVVVHSDCVTPDDLASIPATGPWKGWHFTGDAGRLLPDGRMEIIGRFKDIVKTPDGGLVSPAEVEGVLHALDWVNESAAFSWQDPEGVERLAIAVAVADKGGQEGTSLETTTREAVFKALGAHKVPAQVMILADLPRVGRRKPDKNKLRQMLTAQVEMKRRTFDQ